jgi:hypothetical protein
MLSEVLVVIVVVLLFVVASSSSLSIVLTFSLTNTSPCLSFPSSNESKHESYESTLNRPHQSWRSNQQERLHSIIVKIVGGGGWCAPPGRGKGTGKSRGVAKCALMLNPEMLMLNREMLMLNNTGNAHVER